MGRSMGDIRVAHGNGPRPRRPHRRARTARRQAHCGQYLLRARFSPARVMAVIREMPRQASHPGETIVKSLPWRSAGHRQTSPKTNAHSTFRAEAPSVAPKPGRAALVHACCCRVVRAVDAATGHLTIDLITKIEGNDGQVALALQVRVHKNSRVVRIIDTTNGYHSVAGSQTHSSVFKRFGSWRWR